ncbi:ATP-binding protein [Evansella sp. AB-rgal1]|uniref:ATP-binding protein n=1 Tax=Evansella sp. AB-rgal1 TaxID=3242696 RepID=UPI00359E2131
MKAGRDPVLIEDTSKHPVASKLEVTSTLNIKSFLGVPIVLKNGVMYATLCAIHTSVYKFKEKDIMLMQSMASFLAYVIELENSENLYHQIVENSPDGIMVEKDGQLIYANKATADLYGKANKEDLIGEEVSDIFIQQEDSLIKDPVLEQEEDSTAEEKSIEKKDGSIVSIETIEKPLLYKGEPATQIMVRDITYRKQVEELINNSEKLSVAGQLAAGVAHEIRNPLTGIKGFIQLLKSSATENIQYYDIVLSEVERISEIVSEFLYLAKPEIPVVTKSDILVMVNEVIVLLNTQAIMNNVEIKTEYSMDIPTIQCESNQIKQVLINILKNAIEVMPNGGEIHVSIDKIDNNVMIVIADQGKGIPKERLRRLGEPFYTTKEKGTGLGLMVSRKIMEEHNGRIMFDSVVNEGTTVTMILPI